MKKVFQRTTILSALIVSAVRGQGERPVASPKDRPPPEAPTSGKQRTTSSRISLSGLLRARGGHLSEDAPNGGLNIYLDADRSRPRGMALVAIAPDGSARTDIGKDGKRSPEGALRQVDRTEHQALLDWFDGQIQAELKGMKPTEKAIRKLILHAISVMADAGMGGGGLSEGLKESLAEMHFRNLVDTYQATRTEFVKASKRSQ